MIRTNDYEELTRNRKRESGNAFVMLKTRKKISHHK